MPVIYRFEQDPRAGVHYQPCEHALSRVKLRNVSCEPIKSFCDDYFRTRVIGPFLVSDADTLSSQDSTRGHRPALDEPSLQDLDVHVLLRRETMLDCASLLGFAPYHVHFHAPFSQGEKRRGPVRRRNVFTGTQAYANNRAAGRGCVLLGRWEGAQRRSQQPWRGVHLGRWRGGEARPRHC